MKDDTVAAKYAQSNQCCVPINDRANIAEIRFEKIRDAFLEGAAYGRREALEWVLNNACGTIWGDNWATMIRALEQQLAGGDKQEAKE